MKRVKLVVAYDGTNYCGWQLQPNGITIEEVLNKALSDLLREPIAVIGASRTDSGVHAKGNVAVFDTESRIPAEKICFALNQRLPEDIRVQASEEVPLDWHPRKQNCVKTYEYKILNRKIDMPVGRLYAHFCYFQLDLEKMKQAASYLVGEHDFKSFCTVRTQTEETVRTIYSLTLNKDEEGLITMRISGSGFLYNMVRIIAGTLLKVGMGIYPPEHVEEILDARDRQAAGGTAPAKGLTLVSLEYETKLCPEIAVDNKYWKYRMIQQEIPEKKKGYILIDRCRDLDFDRTVTRLVHQCYRNGAKEIFLTDREPGKNRLAAGQRYGYYCLEEGYQILKLEKKLFEEAGGENQRNVSLEPLAAQDCQQWIDRYNKCFFDTAGSATYTLETVEQEKKQGSRFFWLKTGDERIGFSVLSEKSGTLYLDMIGIDEEHQGKGYGRCAVEAIEDFARFSDLGHLELIAADTNRPALALYKKCGFQIVETCVCFFKASDIWQEK